MRQFTITNSTELINIDGVIGTAAYGISYSLKKRGILKFTKNEAPGTIHIVMVDDTTYDFIYSELIDSTTSLPYVSVDACETALEAFINSGDNESAIAVSTAAIAISTADIDISTAAMAISTSAIEVNTNYSDTLFSSLLTPVAQAQVCSAAKPGYVIIQASSNNAGAILIGPTGVSASNAKLDPGQSTIIESGNLSLWYVKNVTATDVVSVLGEYKN